MCRQLGDPAMLIDATSSSFARTLDQFRETVKAVSGAPSVSAPSMPMDSLVLSGNTAATSLQSDYKSLLKGLAEAAKKVESVLRPPADTPAKPEVPKPEPQKAEPPKAEPPKPAPAPAPTYTVASGDSLSAIAAATLGDADRWHEIFDLNRDQISDPDLIQPGQVLKLPGGAPAAAAPPPPPAPKPAPGPSYTVKSGDSLSAIAAATLGDANRWHEIFDLNRDQLSNPNVIQAGQVLKLPGGAKESAPAPAPASGRNSDRGSVYIQQPNGWTCGPTSLTMAAAAFGLRPATVATVNELVKRTGTSPDYGIPDNNAIPNAARAIGLQAEFSGSSSPAAVRAALQRGHGVILNGSLSPGTGHFIYIAGLNGDGSFKIFDPYRPGITAWNDGDLQHFAYGVTAGHGSMVELWR
ncbi:MAG TPA: LysM peptidoglycan-binding domain-containing protein [Stenomitos sp.]